jgi:hypothetical protein
MRRPSLSFMACSWPSNKWEILDRIYHLDDGGAVCVMVNFESPRAAEDAASAAIIVQELARKIADYGARVDDFILTPELRGRSVSVEGS